MRAPAAGSRRLDAFFGHFDPLDRLQTEQQLDEYTGGAVDTCWTMVPRAFWTFWLKKTPLFVRLERSTVTRWLG